MTTEIGLIEYFMAHAPAEPQEWYTRHFPVLEIGHPEDKKVLNDFYNQYKEMMCGWPLAWAKEQASRAIKNNGRI